MFLPHCPVCFEVRLVCLPRRGVCSGVPIDLRHSVVRIYFGRLRRAWAAVFRTSIMQLDLLVGKIKHICR